MFDIQVVLVYGWTWKKFDKDNEEIMRKILSEENVILGEEVEEAELEEIFQNFVNEKYKLTYVSAIPRRNGEDDTVCYLSLPSQNKQALITSFSTPTDNFNHILKHFNLLSKQPEIYVLPSVDF